MRVFPQEAIKTNILGTENVIRQAMNANVKKVVCLSSDKAVYPVNAMGLTKALMEKLVTSSQYYSDHTQTVVCGTRYGNVLSSRGSVVPLFIEQIKAGKPITITNPNMTRFIMSLEDAMELVMFAFQRGNPGDIFIKKTNAVTIRTLADAVKILMERPDHPEQIIGLRHGEKMHETLLSFEELSKAHDFGGFFRVPSDSRDLNYDNYFENGTWSDDNNRLQCDLDSSVVNLLSVGETVEMLKAVDILSAYENEQNA